jgi:hypothetical protein
VTTTPKGTAEKSDTNVEVANKETVKPIPAQVSSNTVEVVEEETKPTFRERINGVVRNKRIIAGASSVALIVAGVLVVRKRNSTTAESEEENASA